MPVTVGVLRGGPSSEHEVSLKSGAAVLEFLPKNYRGVDVVISSQGIWQINGSSFDPRRLLPRFDVVFNALHGRYGEDGEVQRLLSRSKFTGPKRLGAALAMNKCLAKDALGHCLEVHQPKHQLIRERSDPVVGVSQALDWVGLPVVVKPNEAGSSVGVSILDTADQLLEAVKSGFEHSDSVLIEEYVVGREASCGVVEGLRGERVYPLPPVEIMPPDRSHFFDYSAKYSGETQEICPGRFSRSEKRLMQETAVAAHRELGLRHYSRSDFIIHPERGVFFLETNSLPGITPASLLPLSLETVGVSMSEFLDHVLKLALVGR